MTAKAAARSPNTIPFSCRTAASTKGGARRTSTTREPRVRSRGRRCACAPRTASRTAHISRFPNRRYHADAVPRVTRLPRYTNTSSCPSTRSRRAQSRRSGPIRRLPGPGLRSASDRPRRVRLPGGAKCLPCAAVFSNVRRLAVPKDRDNGFHGRYPGVYETSAAKPSRAKTFSYRSGPNWFAMACGQHPERTLTILAAFGLQEQRVGQALIVHAARAKVYRCDVEELDSALQQGGDDLPGDLRALPLVRYANDSFSDGSESGVMWSTISLIRPNSSSSLPLFMSHLPRAYSA